MSIDTTQPDLSSPWRSRDSGHGALQGVRVVDLSRVLAGPLCTQMCADHGADVIKIEPPFGDETRQLGPPFDAQGTAAYYAAVNRGKRTFSLNLAEAQDQQILLALLAEADVLIENFLPGTMEKWGLGYEDTLAARFPRLVYCRISGFGVDGPMGGLPGYDAVLQAICGLMSINGAPESGPTRMGVPIVDHLTSYTALTGICMALLARARSGRGQLVEATLYDAALSLLVPHAMNWIQSGNTPQLLGSAHPNIAPYERFAARDGEVFLGILNDAQFRKFAKCMQRPELASDARYSSNPLRLHNRAQLRAEITGLFAAWDKAPLCALLMQSGVPAGSVNTVPEALASAHTQHRQMLVEQDGYQGLGLPIRLHGTPGQIGHAPPAFNEHAAIKAQLARSVAVAKDSKEAPSASFEDG